MTHSKEVWDNILSLTRKTCKRKLVDDTHPEDWGVDTKYDALTSLLHGAVSHPDMKVRADYVGRITKLPDQYTQKSLMDMIARQKQEIEGSRKEKRLKRSHTVHDEANTPGRCISKSGAPSTRKPQRTPFTPKSSLSKTSEASDGNGRRSLFTTPRRTTSSADGDSIKFGMGTKTPGFLSPGLGDTAEYEKEVQGLREQNEQLLSTIAKYKRHEEEMESKYEEMESKYRNEMMKIEAASCQRNEEIQEELQGKIHTLENSLNEVLKQMEASEEAKSELKTMRDEMEVMKHTKSLLDDTTERLNHYKEKLTQLTDIKDALEKEEEAHSRSVDENIRLKNELSSLYCMKRNLDDYKSRAVEAEVRFAELQDEMTTLNKKFNDTNKERENLQIMVESQKEEIQNLRQQTRHEEMAVGGGWQVGSGLCELNPEIKEELLRLRNENEQLREFAQKREDDAVIKLELQVEDTNRLAERYKSQFLSTKGKLETTQSDLEKSISRELELQGDRERVLEESSHMQKQLEVLRLELTNVRQNLDESRSRESMLEDELSSWVEQARALQANIDEMTNRLQQCNENLEKADSREVILKDKITDLELNMQKCNQQSSFLSLQLEVQENELRDSKERCEELLQDLSEWVEKAKSASDLANDISDNLAGCAAELHESKSENILLRKKLNDVSKVLQSTQLELKEEHQRLCRAKAELQDYKSNMESAKQREQSLYSDLHRANEVVNHSNGLLNEKKKEIARLKEKVQDVLDERQQLLAREESLVLTVQELRATTETMNKQITSTQQEADTFNQEKNKALRELQKSQEENLYLASRIADIESAAEESKAKAEVCLQQKQTMAYKLTQSEEHLTKMKDSLKNMRNVETETKELLADAQCKICELDEKVQQEQRMRAAVEEEMMCLRDANKKMEVDYNASIEDMRTKWQKELRIARVQKNEIARLNEVVNESQSSISAAQHRENMLQHKIRVLEDKESELRAAVEATRDEANKEVLEATKSFEARHEILTAQSTKAAEELQKKMSMLLEEERREKRQLELECNEKLNQLKEQMEINLANVKDEAAIIVERTEKEADARHHQMQKEYEEMISNLKNDANRESTELVRKGKGMLKELKIQHLEEKGKLENQIKLLEGRCSGLVNEKESTVSNCNSKVREYRKKLQLASARITQLTTESDDLEGQIEALSRESSKLREENDRYRRQLGGRFGAESNAQNEMLRKELKSACDEIRELKRQKGASLPSRTGNGPGETKQIHHRDLASQSTISQLRIEYEETIEALNDEKRELVMRNAAAITDVQKAEMRAWETDKENSALKEELVSLRLQVERLGKIVLEDQQNTDDLRTVTELDENIPTVKPVQFRQNSGGRSTGMDQKDGTEDNSNSAEQFTQSVVKTELPKEFQQEQEEQQGSDEHPPDCKQS